MWGSVARAVTGGHVPVKSILTGAHADPHSYQASPADAAAIVDAELVIYNGGGYDPWVDQVPRRLPRCPVLRRDQVVLEMIVITMVGRPSGP
ncbi:zinc/manganese transporter substrate-binding protein, partial [Mycobacterium tuberculosis variant bovis B2 7505]